jgi:hypothetical protein
MSVDATSWVWNHSKAKRSARLVLLCIADHAHSDGTNAWPGLKRIAERTQLSERRVQDAIRELISKGELERTVNGGGPANMRADKRPNLYKVVLPKTKSGMDEVSTPQSNGADEVSTPRDGRSVYPGAGRGMDEVSTQTVREKIEPSVKNPLAIASPQKRDLLFESLISELGISAEDLTSTSRGAVNKALKELRAVGATPVELRRRCGIYRETYPNLSLTAPALAKHWPQLARGQPVSNGTGISQNRRNIISAAKKQGVI